MRLPAHILIDHASVTRVSVRRTIDSATTLRCSLNDPVDVTVRDLSQSGCFVETNEHVAVKDEVRIGIAGVGAIEATVVRVAMDGFAIAFHDALAADALERAFSQSTIVNNGAWAKSISTSTSPELDHERWPRPVRTAVAIGSAVFLWTLVAWAIS